MDTAEAWIKLLYTYGPFAILVFLVFVTERKTRTAMKEAARDEKQRMTVVYLLNWAVIFGLVLFSMYAWTRLNLNDEPTIKGRIENLSGREVVSTGSASFFVHRVYVLPGRAEYMWRLVGQKKFTEGEKIIIVLDPNDPNLGEAGITNNELTIKKGFYDREVRITYRRDVNKLFIDESGQQVELPQSQQLIADAPTQKSAWDFLTTSAHAQGQFQSAPFISSLESPDPIIRRNARADLARQGASAVPWIEDCWNNPKSSYRLKLGTLVALNNMSSVNTSALRPSTITEFQRASSDPDTTLRNEALTFLNRYRIPFPVTVFEHANSGGRSQTFGEGRYRADYGQLGKLPNDTASSVKVTKGYRVRLCENEGVGKAAGRCQEFGEGTFNLSVAKAGGVADRVSMIEVFRPAGPQQLKKK
jgi:hypothetical protein